MQCNDHVRIWCVFVESECDCPYQNWSVGLFIPLWALFRSLRSLQSPAWIDGKTSTLNKQIMETQTVKIHIMVERGECCGKGDGEGHGKFRPFLTDLWVAKFPNNQPAQICWTSYLLSKRPQHHFVKLHFCSVLLVQRQVLSFFGVPYFFVGEDSCISSWQKCVIYIHIYI